MGRRRSARASSALLVWMRGLCTSILLAAFCSSLLHYVVVAHVHCEEHGELAHGSRDSTSHEADSDHDHAPPHDEADGDELGPRLLGGEHDSHCQSCGVLPSLAAELPSAVLSKRLGAFELIDRLTATPVDVRRDLFRLAPKQSPPV